MCDAWNVGGRDSRGTEDENEMPAEPPALWAAEKVQGSSLPSMPQGRKGTSAGPNELHAGREFAFGVMFAVPRIPIFWGQECFLRFGSLHHHLWLDTCHFEAS